MIIQLSTLQKNRACAITHMTVRESLLHSYSAKLPLSPKSTSATQSLSVIITTISMPICLTAEQNTSSNYYHYLFARDILGRVVMPALGVVLAAVVAVLGAAALAAAGPAGRRLLGPHEVEARSTHDRCSPPARARALGNSTRCTLMRRSWLYPDAVPAAAPRSRGFAHLRFCGARQRGTRVE